MSHLVIVMGRRNLIIIVKVLKYVLDGEPHSISIGKTYKMNNDLGFTKSLMEYDLKMKRGKQLNVNIFAISVRNF